MTTWQNPFLEGNFAPVSTETDGELLVVDGEIPADLKGFFLRIGPNPRFVLDASEYHWFDGDGMIHRVWFRDGKAYYRNRFVQTGALRAETAQGKAIWPGMNGKPQLRNADGPIKNPANTALVWHGHRLLALWEGGKPHEIRLPDLATIKAENWGGELNYPFSAHPHIDPRTGEMRVVCYRLPMPPHVKYFVFSANGKLLHQTAVDMPKAVMMHDSAITENYTLILDFPSTWDWGRLLRGQHAIDWEPENGARIGVIPRLGRNRDILWFPVKTGFAFHTVNAYEDGDQIILDAARMELGAVLRGLDDQDLVEKQEGRFYRWTLNMQDGTVKEHQLADQPVEFPQINPDFKTRPYRYAYAALNARVRDGAKFNGLIKLDRKNDTTTVFQMPANTYNGEAVFVAREGARREDDGYLLLLTHNENENESQLLILDARDLGAEPLARLQIPARVPYGFHAYWVSQRQVDQQLVTTLEDVSATEPGYSNREMVKGLWRALRRRLR